MKKLLHKTSTSPLLTILLITLHFSLFTIHCEAQPGQWTWMNGSSANNQLGVFGTQGIFAAGNTPPSFYEACEWTDLNGNFWLFGGQSNGSSYQDLWEFHAATNMWAWIKGPGIADLYGIYGTQGVPSPTNIPGSRSFGVATWVDTAGDLWLFGGNGRASTNIGEMNDLWRYNIATKEWTWMNGSDTANNPGSYGTILVPAPTNHPPARCGTNAAWKDDANNLWLFGGYVYNVGTFSDLWKYDISTNQWTWMKGPNVMNQPASYGTLGVPDIANQPSCRSVFAKWKDHAGNFYMFGGNKSNFNNLNDMWRFNPITFEWTWMNGSNASNDTTSDNAQCLTAPTNHPGARYENRACWTLPCDNFAFFGGASGAGGFSDLWNYNVASNQWTLMSGITATGGAGNYGTITVSSATNMPPSRFGSLGWKDTVGNLWLFGGETSPDFNDMWRFVRDTLCPFIPNDHVISSFNTSSNSGCMPDTVNFYNTSTNGTYFYWNFGDSVKSSVVSPSHTYTIPGTYYVTLIAIPSCGGNPDTARDTIIVHPLPTPTITSTLQDTFCQGLIDTLSTQLYSSYIWNTALPATTQYVIADSSATYSVTVTDANGCTAITSRTIVVIPFPFLSSSFFSDTVTGCSPFIVHFNNGSIGATSYLWNFGDNTTDTAKNPYHTYTNADSTVYSVYLVAIHSGPCGIIQDTFFRNNYVFINIYRPVAKFTSNYLLPVYAGDSIHFRDESYDFYSFLTYWQWSFGDTSGSDFMNPIHSWDVAGMYQVKLIVTDYNGCKDTAVYDYIQVIEGLVDVPNTFTPNNDGYNDFFEIRASGMQVYNLEIFNRWGMLQFQTTGNNVLWDGYDQAGLQCPDGTYYYTLKATGESGKDFSKAGFILLLR